MGKRMRPHTHTTAKPLLPIAGKPIVQRLVEDLAAVAGEKVEEVAFITNPAFGPKVEKELLEIAQAVGAKGSIHHQTEALGTAHAILCAKDALEGPVIVAFGAAHEDVDPDACIECGSCESACPNGAIMPEKKLKPVWADFAWIDATWFSDPDAARSVVDELAAVA